MKRKRDNPLPSDSEEAPQRIERVDTTVAGASGAIVMDVTTLKSIIAEVFRAEKESLVKDALAKVDEVGERIAAQLETKLDRIVQRVETEFNSVLALAMEMNMRQTMLSQNVESDWKKILEHQNKAKVQGEDKTVLTLEVKLGDSVAR